MTRFPVLASGQKHKRGKGTNPGSRKSSGVIHLMPASVRFDSVIYDSVPSAVSGWFPALKPHFLELFFQVSLLGKRQPEKGGGVGRKEEPGDFFLLMLPRVLTAVSVARLTALVQMKILPHVWLPLTAGSSRKPQMLCSGYAPPCIIFPFLRHPAFSCPRWLIITINFTDVKTA